MKKLEKAQVNDIHKELTSFFLNLNAEVLVAEILENSELEEEDITILLKGSFERGYRRDIVETKIDLNDKLQINISRNGIYDALPQGIFHSPVKGNANLSYSELRQLSKKEERDARKLFAPIENEFFLQKVAINQNEQKIEQAFNNVDHSFLLEFWGLKNKVADAYVFQLAKLLPLAYKISGNIKLMQQALSLILDESVEIIKSYVPLVNKTATKNKDSILGVNSVLAVDETEAYYPLYTIIITLNTLKSKKKFEKNGIGSELISVFCGYFVPLEVDWKVKLEYDSYKTSFILSSDDSILGLSVSL